MIIDYGDPNFEKLGLQCIESKDEFIVTIKGWKAKPIASGLKHYRFSIVGAKLHSLRPIAYGLIAPSDRGARHASNGRIQRRQRFAHDAPVLGLVAAADFNLTQPRRVFHHHPAALPAPRREAGQRLFDAGGAT